jgi:hypothetical protein
MKHKKTKRCSSCGGRGTLPEPNQRLKCQECDGTGHAQQMEMIFWPYDRFPFILAAPGFMQDSGCAYVPSFQGSFRPMKVMPLEEGKVLQRKISLLALERVQTLQALENGWRCQLDYMAPWLNRFKKTPTKKGKR